MLKSARHHYYGMFAWLSDRLSWKKSALVRYEILDLFVNTLTAEYIYSRRNMQNFLQQIQTQLSQNRKSFFQVFRSFLKCASSLEHFRKKDEPSSLSIPKIIESKGSAYLNVYKALLRNTFR